jgi:predicted Zn finger-like uncharacterized protein
MFTTCPECGTVFRVTTAQLRMAEGFVRCGHCAAEFNALATLSDELPTPAAPPPAASGWTGRYPAATGTFAAPAAASPPPASMAPAPVEADVTAWRDGWFGRGAEPAPGGDAATDPGDEAPDGLDEDDEDRDGEFAAGLATALPGDDHGDGDDDGDDAAGGVYVIEGETPEWAARIEAEEPVLAQAVAPVFGAPAATPAATLATADEDGPEDAGDDAADGDAAADAADAGTEADAWDSGADEDDDEDDADATVLAPDADADVDWEALLGEVDDDEPAAPVYVVEGEPPVPPPAGDTAAVPAAAAPAADDVREPPPPSPAPSPPPTAATLARDFADPADDDAELDAALAAMDTEVGVGDATVMATALADDDPPRPPGPATVDAPADDADATADFPVLRVPPEFRRDLAPHLAAADDAADDAPAGPPDPLIVVAEDEAGPVVVLADEPRPAAADDDWPRFDPANPPWDAPPEPRAAERPASVAELPPLWHDRPAWPPAADEPSRRSWPWAVGSLVLALALGGQLLVQQRDELATHPEYGPRIRAAFEAVGLRVYPAWNLSAYTVRGSEAVAGRTAPGALDVVANIAVTGTEPVGLPIVRVTLRDRWNEAIGTRAFSARDYLDPASTLRDPLPPGTLIPVRVRIADPGTEAFGYEVDVCLMDRRTGLTCQAGREPFRP